MVGATGLEPRDFACVSPVDQVFHCGSGETWHPLGRTWEVGPRLARRHGRAGGLRLASTIVIRGRRGLPARSKGHAALLGIRFRGGASAQASAVVARRVTIWLILPPHRLARRRLEASRPAHTKSMTASCRCLEGLALGTRWSAPCGDRRDARSGRWMRLPSGNHQVTVSPSHTRRWNGRPPRPTRGHRYRQTLRRPRIQSQPTSRETCLDHDHPGPRGGPAQ